MRIYSNDNTQSNTDSYWFDEYVGKDVWVKCIASNREYYVRFLSITTAKHLPYVLVNRVRVQELDEVDTSLLAAMWVTTGCFDPVEPLEVYTTQELFPGSENTSDNLQIFNRFCGKDFWIHVGNESECDWWDSGYLKVDAIEGLVIKGTYILDYYVDNFYVHADVYDRFPSESFQQVATCIDAWDIFKPVDGCSTQELNEILDVNDNYLASIIPEDDY